MEGTKQKGALVYVINDIDSRDYHICEMAADLLKDYRSIYQYRCFFRLLNGSGVVISTDTAKMVLEDVAVDGWMNMAAFNKLLEKKNNEPIKAILPTYQRICEKDIQGMVPAYRGVYKNDICQMFDECIRIKNDQPA